VPDVQRRFANSFVARALLVDEVMGNGAHFGGSSVPTALAVAEPSRRLLGKGIFWLP